MFPVTHELIVLLGDCWSGGTHRTSFVGSRCNHNILRVTDTKNSSKIMQHQKLYTIKYPLYGILGILRSFEALKCGSKIEYTYNYAKSIHMDSFFFMM